jgi:3-phosphoshikimate 1-carboxyvinyltransferase
VLAGRARGVSVIGGIDSLKSKESDRVASTLALLAALGVKASYKKGALTVAGAKKFAAAGPARTFNDHRIAMAAGAASTACPGLKTEDPACVDKSSPGFWDDLRSTFRG